MLRRITISFLIFGFSQAQEPLKLNSLDYFEARGLNVFVFTEWYNDLFSDSKMSGIEIIHHGIRTATNGDVRLHHTPEQWDPIPQFVERKIDREKGVVEAFLKYSVYDFEYSIRVQARDVSFEVSVILGKPLPKELEGVAGFNLEFLPSAYFEKAYTIDGNSGFFPLYPGGPMKKDAQGVTEPKPIASGTLLVLAPEDPERRITIQSQSDVLMLFDGRNKAQNGWYVVRSLLPKGKTGKVLEWRITPNIVPNWTRPPVITYSQIGYHPRQKKVAVIELDKNDRLITEARLLKVGDDGSMATSFSGEVKNWGSYLRYNYGAFDFSEVRQPGLYMLEYGNHRTKVFAIGENVHASAWHPTMDVFFPVQMDHMLVNEAYRVWHGASHLDDALQAPVDHDHFDLYAQGTTTDSPYKPGEHIPGLNVGGWFDAGDFDLRTQSQYATVLSFVMTWELFHPERDETTVDQKNRFVDIHHPDGKPDLVQQIEHGTLQLLAQHKAVGHAIPGIVEAHLSQYTHLGDAVTKTDNLVYNPKLDSLQADGRTSGTFDDRWAFTTRTTALNYGSTAALAAASRVLRGFNDALAEECLATARKVWDEEHSREPALFRHGNTTGGVVADEELRAAVELLITTKEKRYSERILQLWPTIERRKNSYGWSLANCGSSLAGFETAFNRPTGQSAGS